MIPNSLKRMVPAPVLRRGAAARDSAKKAWARARFNRSALHPEWLDPNLLPKLQAKYKFPPEYGYERDQLAARGRERAEQILRETLPGTSPNAFLELGSGDAMVSCALQTLGKRATAVDMDGNKFDPRAVQAGVVVKHMDAAHLEFADACFDFVFSYNAFEHFADPGAVLREAARVLKEGGLLYLYFGPLGMSPLGLHAYRIITVPYCQFLFPPGTISDFAKKSNVAEEIPYINGWPADAYRKLWRADHGLETLRYREETHEYGLELVAKYPSCFRSKTDNFENLLVSSMEALFRKGR